MAEITDGPELVEGGAKDGVVYRYGYSQEGVSGAVYVELSGSLVASSTDVLASPLNVIAATKGRAAVEDALAKGKTPRSIVVSTSGIIEDPP